MNVEHTPMRRRGLVAIDGAMALIVLLLVVQIWLLSATLESFLAGNADVVLPAAIFSGLIFLACLALNLFVDRVDQESRHP
jgi:F0F1-type ATP synthase assembly protein I